MWQRAFHAQNVGAHYHFNNCAGNHDKGRLRSRYHIFVQALSEIELMAEVNSAQNLVKPHLDTSASSSSKNPTPGLTYYEQTL
jgi:hypothetical protein